MSARTARHTEHIFGAVRRPHGTGVRREAARGAALDAHIREEADAPAHGGRSSRIGARPAYFEMGGARAQRWRRAPRPQQCVSEDRGRRDLILNSWTPMSIKSDTGSVAMGA